MELHVLVVTLVGLVDLTGLVGELRDGLSGTLSAAAHTGGEEGKCTAGGSTSEGSSDDRLVICKAHFFGIGLFKHKNNFKRRREENG